MKLNKLFDSGILRLFFVFAVLADFRAFATPEVVAARVSTEVSAVCKKILQQVDAQWSHVGTISEEVAEQFPDSPLKRGVELRQRLDQNASAVGPNEIAPDKRDVFFRGNTFTDLVAQEFPQLNTVLYYSRFGLIPEGSQIILPWGHGWTAMESHSGGVMQQVNFMTSRKGSGSYREIKDSTTGNWMPVASMAVDAPLHGAGPRDVRFMNFEESLAWRLELYQYLQAQAPELPLVVGTRSGESLVAATLNQRYPGLIKGMILMSPVHPAAGTLEGFEGYHQNNIKYGDAISPTAFRWLERIVNQMHAYPKDQRWWEEESPLGKTPTLILTGSEDAETPRETREEFKRMAAAHPDRVYYLEIEGAGHNVFATKTQPDKIRALIAWDHVYWFLRAKVLKDPNVNPVPQRIRTVLP